MARKILKQAEALYRPILRDAWNLTWSRKRLWVFGFFAAIISTGGVADVLLRTARRADSVSTLLTNALRGSVAGLDYFGAYIQQLAGLPVASMTFAVACFLTGLIVTWLFAVWTQKALTQGLIGGKCRHHIFWRVLELALLTKAAYLVITLPTVLILTLLSLRAPENGLAYFLVFVIFFALIIIVSIVSAIALVDIMKAGTHSLDAIQNALRYFSRHVLITFELGVLLFFLVFGAGALTLLAVAVLTFPYSLLQILALSLGSYGLLIATHVIGIALLILITALFIGISTTFQYACWVLFYERAVKRGVARTMKAKLLRMLTLEP